MPSFLLIATVWSLRSSISIEEPSALYGSTDRGADILRNPIYSGRLIRHKVHMAKDLDTSA